VTAATEARPGSYVPAWYCPNAVHVLKWEPFTLDWVLYLLDEPVGTLPGYPVGSRGIPGPAALEWADAAIGTPQVWISRPDNSCVWHTHTDPAATCPPPLRPDAPPVVPTTLLCGVVDRIEPRKSTQGNAWARLRLITGGATWPVDVFPRPFREYGHLLTRGASVEIEARRNSQPEWSPFLAWEIRPGATPSSEGDQPCRSL
jgi:hypothetical protein